MILSASPTASAVAAAAAVGALAGALSCATHFQGSSMGERGAKALQVLAKESEEIASDSLSRERSDGRQACELQGEHSICCQRASM